MTPEQVKTASKAIERWREAKFVLSQLEGRYVTGVSLAFSEYQPGDADLRRFLSKDGDSRLPTDLVAALTTTLKNWSEGRVSAAEEEARAAGVVIDANDF